METPKTLVMGAGAAGLTAACELAALGIDIIMVEKKPFPGGHAVQLACKALDACVHCGACLIEAKLAETIAHPRIHIFSASRVTELKQTSSDDPFARFSATIEQGGRYIDGNRCNNCGECLAACPEEGALIRGTSAHHGPFWAIDQNHCRQFQKKDCRLCETACTQDAINLDQKVKRHSVEIDAVIVATGFKTFDPHQKPYGYGRFKNVITTLEAENMLRAKGTLVRPSDGNLPRTIAFIQCVGSRDKQLGHLWCSKICCGTSLRLARCLKQRQPQTDSTIFYIDIQTFGKNFETYFHQAQKEIEFLRIIPADIFETDHQNLKLNYFDPAGQQNGGAVFDLVVLAVGLAPRTDQQAMAHLTGLGLNSDGYFQPPSDAEHRSLFVCGTATGPASIAETMAQAEASALSAYAHLKGRP